MGKQNQVLLYHHIFYTTIFQLILMSYTRFVKLYWIENKKQNTTVFTEAD